MDNGSARGKGNIVFNKRSDGDFEFSTLLFPFNHFDQRIPESEVKSTANLFDYSIHFNEEYGVWIEDETLGCLTLIMLRLT